MSFLHVSKAVLFFALALTTAYGGDDAEPYAGIEIGSKGVKGVVLDVWTSVKLDRNKNVQESKYDVSKISFRKTYNTSIMILDPETKEFTDEAMAETTEAVKQFHDIARQDYKVKDDNIFVIASSGVAKVAFEKQESGRRLYAAIRKRTGKATEFLSVEKESQHLIKGLINADDLTKSCIIDIGFGNTKVGYQILGNPNLLGAFLTPHAFIPGVRAFKQIITKNGVITKDQDIIDNERRKNVELPLIHAIDGKPRLQNAEKFYLNGGIVWAMTILLHPDQVRVEKRAAPRTGKSFISISPDDISEFYKLLAKASGFPPARWDLVKDPMVMEAAEAEWREVKDTFTVEDLIAGAEVLRGVSAACRLEGKTGTKAKELCFPRDGQFAWVLSYVIDKRITEEVARLK